MSPPEAAQVAMARTHSGFFTIEAHGAASAPWGYEIQVGRGRGLDPAQGYRELLQLFLEKGQMALDFVGLVKGAIAIKDKELLADLLTSGAPTEGLFGCIMTLRNAIWGGEINLGHDTTTVLEERMIEGGLMPRASRLWLHIPTMYSVHDATELSKKIF